MALSIQEQEAKLLENHWLLTKAKSIICVNGVQYERLIKRFGEYQEATEQDVNQYGSEEIKNAYNKQNHPQEDSNTQNSTEKTPEKQSQESKSDGKENNK